MPQTLVLYSEINSKSMLHAISINRDAEGELLAPCSESYPVCSHAAMLLICTSTWAAATLPEQSWRLQA